MIYFTSDTHFGTDAYSILKREMRPFANPAEYMHNQVEMWNIQAGKKDIIYHLGDFVITTMLKKTGRAAYKQ